MVQSLFSMRAEHSRGMFSFEVPEGWRREDRQVSGKERIFIYPPKKFLKTDPSYISLAAVAGSNLEDADERERLWAMQLHAAGHVVRQGLEILLGGERNVVSLQYSGPRFPRGHIGYLISAYRDGNEYILDSQIGPKYVDAVRSVADSFAFNR